MGRKLGKWDKVQIRDSRGCKAIKMASCVCWVKQVGVDPSPPQGERPRFHSRIDMIVRRCKFAKMLKRRAAPYGENLKIIGPQM